MPKYYLHICNGAGFTEDEEGQDFADASAARAAAIHGFRGLLAGELAEGQLNVASFIEIEDENRELVGTVSFEEAVNITKDGCERPQR